MAMPLPWLSGYDAWLPSVSSLTTGGAEEMLELLSTQEEADICLLLHAALEGHNAVSSSQMKKRFCVWRFFPHIGAPLYLRCGTRIHTRFVSIQGVVNSDCCKSMSGLHTFTGCDSYNKYFCWSRQLKYFADYSERQEGHVCRARVLLGN